MNFMISMRKPLSNHMPPRRSVLIGALALAGATALPAWAYSVNEAKALIGKVVADITRIINSGKSEARMYRDFEGIFSRYADSGVIAQLVLGPDGRSASAAQKRAFAGAFQKYMARKYGRRFREFIGAKVEVKRARAVKSFFEVDTVAKLSGRSPFDVTFVVSGRNGRFIDMKIEGISLVKTERAEIGAMLDKRGGNLDRLINDLRG